VGLGGPVLVDEVHRATFERDDDSRVIVVVHRQRRVRQDDRLPDLDVFIVELREALRLLGCLLGTHDSEDKQWECKIACSTKQFLLHRGSFLGGRIAFIRTCIIGFIRAAYIVNSHGQQD